MAPASGFLQNAPKSGLGANGAITGCGARYQVDGVTFRMVRFDPRGTARFPTTAASDIAALMARTDLVDINAAPPTDQADLSLLRNRLAHAALGTDQLASLPRDPFAIESYGALDALRSAKDGMTDDDVALALVYWTRIGMRFVDMWSLRRRPVPAGFGLPWDPLAGPRRQREAEATLMQFQDHLQTLRNPASIAATTYFRYLPAAGLLPLSLGFDLATFTQGMVVRGPISDQVFLDGARLGALLQTSLGYPPVDLTVHEMLWLYSVVENRIGVDTATAPVPSAYVAFARGQMPFFGIPREDVNRWDYSTYV
jgi:hypothetical protein